MGATVHHPTVVGAQSGNDDILRPEVCKKPVTGKIGVQFDLIDCRRYHGHFKHGFEMQFEKLVYASRCFELSTTSS
jgi:hypothetical protein